MSYLEIINIFAIIVIPIFAVWFGIFLQDKAEKRKDKIEIFKSLMTARIYDWTNDSVNSLNIIDIVFADDKKVRNAWKDLLDKYTVDADKLDQQQIEKIKKAKYKLLEEIANSLGYKDKITWETIQNPYCPIGLSNQLQMQNLYNQNLVSISQGMLSMISNNNTDSTGTKTIN